MNRGRLIDRVIEQIKVEVHENDFTAIEGLLDCLTTEQLKAYLPEDDMPEPANVIVHDLGSDTTMTFTGGVLPAWAVRYAYAESVGRLPKLLELRDANAYEAEVNIFFHVSRGPRSVSCGDFAASTEED